MTFAYDRTLTLQTLGKGERSQESFRRGGVWYSWGKILHFKQPALFGGQPRPQGAFPWLWKSALGTAFLALIPPSFTSLNPFVTFFRPLQPHSSSHNWGTSMRIPGSTPTLSIICRKCSHAKQAAHTKSSRLRMSEENFRTELSRITFYDYIIYPKL